MRHLFTRFIDGTIRMAGGQPHVVRPLYSAIEKAAAGSHELLRQKSRRRLTLSAPHLRLLMLTATFLGSILLSLTMLVNPSDLHPPLGVLVLAGVHWLLVSGMVLGQAGPSLLVDDDLRLMGWWPITRRELMLARLGTLLKPAWQTTLALMAVPLVVYAFTGQPKVVTALALGLGILIQAVCIIFGVAVSLSLVVRAFGRDKAQRLAGILADGSTFMYVFLLFILAQKAWPWLEAHLGVLYALPPLWFAAFGDLASGARSWVPAGVGLLVTGLLVAVGLRLMIPADKGAETVRVDRTPPRWHISQAVSWLMRPWMRGREGWALRRLLEAHLREDWRFIGGMVTMPVMMAVMFFGLDRGLPADLDQAELSLTALTSVRHSHFLAIMAANVLHLTAFSSTPRALWIVALADLDTSRLLSAQRGLIRGLVTVPILLLYGWKARTFGTSWPVVGLDMLLLGLQVEIIVTVLQPVLMVMPFSRGYTNDQSLRRMFVVFMSMGVAVVFVLLNFLYASWGPARYLVWVGLPLLLLLARWWQVRQVGDRRLNMEMVVG